jgi:SAM-dependent methyltransferase
MSSHPQGSSCPLCASPAPCVFLHASQLDRIPGTEYTYLRCRNCGFVFLDQKVSPEASHYDESGYYDRRASLLADVIEPLMNLLNRLRLLIVERAWRRPPGRILDIGCGKGRFLAQARKAGWECMGIEPTERSWRVAVQEYGLDVVTKPLKDDHFSPQSFEVVTLWHTLEHIPDPVSVMSSAYRWLVPGGLAVVAIPNIASLQARLGGSLWFHLDPPRHLSHFTPKTANRLLVSCGFENPQVRFFYPELNGFGMIQTVLNRLGLSPNFLFNLLKRNQAGLPPSRAMLALNLAGVLLLLCATWPLLLLMTWLEEWTGQGGTMVLMARRPLEKPGGRQ